MTVKELIEALEKVENKDMDVVMRYWTPWNSDESGESTCHYIDPIRIEDDKVILRMTPEQALKQAQANPILLVVTGSRMYGTNRPDSDTDKRGVVVPPWEFMVSRGYDQSLIEGEEDGHMWSFGYYIKGLLQSNPQFLELLYAPNDCIISIKPLGQELIDNRSWFASKKLYKRLMGFAYSEHRKAMGVKVELEKRSHSEDEAIRILSHALRLLFQCTEMLETGGMTFPLRMADLLKRIKCGEMSKEAYSDVYDAAKIHCDLAYKDSTIQDQPNHKMVQEWYEDKLAEILATDPRFITRFADVYYSKDLIA